MRRIAAVLIWHLAQVLYSDTRDCKKHTQGIWISFWLNVNCGEQKRRSEEQLSQLEDSEKEHRGKLLRLQVELEEKHERWLSCQQRCDAMQKQLLSCSQREEQMNRKYFAAAEEVTQLRRALENTEQETRELKKERQLNHLQRPPATHERTRSSLVFLTLFTLQHFATHLQHLSYHHSFCAST